MKRPNKPLSKNPVLSERYAKPVGPPQKQVRPGAKKGSKIRTLPTWLEWIESGYKNRPVGKFPEVTNIRAAP